MKNDVNATHIVPSKLAAVLEKAAEFHGHLGPFLVIGVRIGLIGLKEISKHNGEQLTIDLSLPLHVPFSCIIDGLQVTTHCTVGNQKLSVRDSGSVKARFIGENKGVEVMIALNKSTFEELKFQLLGESIPEEEVRRLAWMIAEISEDKLFEISRTTRTH
ncbi:MAG: formylmethanofuran dehydrogenase subunit E family protein [Candidatus Bathyarchaeota archaeon]|nr:MAG: formylmethanofuran dehydrogenase subunit E family protein [Candidatus Bathyarchaeota archaeon]